MTLRDHIFKFAIMIVVVSCHTAGAATEIRLRERVELGGAVVRLGDVAEVLTADRQQARQLASLPLMPAPAPGTQRFLRRREVEDLLTAHGANLTALRLVGVEQVAITVTSDGWNPAAGEHQGDAAAPANRHAAVLAGQPYQPPPKRDAPPTEPMEPEVVATAIPVVVASRPIARGEVITAAHVEVQSIEGLPKGAARRPPLDSVEKLLGMEARQPIAAGDILFGDQVRSPLLVKRGELITVVSAGGGIRVRTTARAREDGARGDLVQVESLETRERYDARIVALREATVFAPPRTRTTGTDHAEVASHQGAHPRNQ